MKEIFTRPPPAPPTPPEDEQLPSKAAAIFDAAERATADLQVDTSLPQFPFKSKREIDPTPQVLKMSQKPRKPRVKRADLGLPPRKEEKVPLARDFFKDQYETVLKALRDAKFDRKEAAAALTVSQRDLTKLLIDLERMGYTFDPSEFTSGITKKARIIETKVGASIEELERVSKTEPPEPEPSTLSRFRTLCLFL